MACTPKKLVHWSGETEIAEYSYGSPGSDASSVNATSTLQYVNSQLVAHGFSSPPGLSLEGTSRDDEEKCIKCLFSMLSQRMEDMSQMERLSTKLQNLSYEHERLSSMYRATEEKLTFAEKETNLYKQRLAGANKTIQSSENAHKTTSAELQRARTALHSVRQTNAAELKRKEKEMERMVERWSKISDSQVKLGSTASGLFFKTTPANPVSSTRDGEVIGKDKSLLEDALEEAERARKALEGENAGLKTVVLAAANELARATHRSEEGEVDDQQAQFAMEDIFSLSAPGSPSERLKRLLNAVRDRIRQLASESNDVSTTPAGEPSAESIAPAALVTTKHDDNTHRDQSKEILRLQNTIIDLRRQLEQAQVQKQSGTYADQAQAIVRRFVENDTSNIGPSNRADERNVLEKLRKELDSARSKVDEAALRLKDEKDTLEEERQAFYRERRLWKSQMGILHDEGAQPGPSNLGVDGYFDAPVEPIDIPLPPSPQRTSRKYKKSRSPKKPTAKAGGPIMQIRSPAKPVFAVGKVKKGRGSMSRKPHGVSLGASTSKPKVIPPMETEVVPGTLAASRAAASLIVPNAFVLPPPSPLTSIPPQPGLLSSLKPLPQPSFTSNEEGSSSSGSSNDAPSSSSLTPPAPFAMAKPFGKHLMHAYSPARPSPLSRILLLSESPSEVPEDSRELPVRVRGISHQDSIPHEPPAPYNAFMSLEEELGIAADESPSDESPLREKNVRMANKGISKKDNPSKGKAKTRAPTAKPVRVPLETEKENLLKKARAGMTLTARPAGASRGGARRVPIGSADAAPVGPSWK